VEEEKTPTTSDAEDVEAHGTLDRPGEADREALDAPDVEAHGLEARPVENRPVEN